MTMRIANVTIDSNELAAAQAFWQAVTGYTVSSADDTYVFLVDPRGKGTALGLQAVPEPRTGKNRLHLDLSTDDLAGETSRVVGLGATEIEHHSEGGSKWVVLADTDGNQFCIVAE